MTGEQLAFGHVLIAPPVPARTPTLAERFEAFHRRNPHVFKAIAGRALEECRKGATRIRVKRIIENMRDQVRVNTTGESYKFDNSYTSFYAAMLAEQYPELDRLIERRK